MQVFAMCLQQSFTSAQLGNEKEIECLLERNDEHHYDYDKRDLVPRTTVPKPSNTSSNGNNYNNVKEKFNDEDAGM